MIVGYSNKFPKDCPMKEDWMYAVCPKVGCSWYSVCPIVPQDYWDGKVGLHCYIHNGFFTAPSCFRVYLKDVDFSFLEIRYKDYPVNIEDIERHFADL